MRGWISCPTSEELETRRRQLTQLQGGQQLLNQRLETVLGASRQEWRLAEAEHLLRLASLRLSALQDINSATALVSAADEILQEQDDPAAFAAREQLAKSLQALRSTLTRIVPGCFCSSVRCVSRSRSSMRKAPSFSGEGGVLNELAAAEGAQTEQMVAAWPADLVGILPPRLQCGSQYPALAGSGRV